MLPEDPILLPEIIDHVFLVAVHPASGREYEEAQSVWHSLRLLGEQPLAPTSFRRFANLGLFVAPYGDGEQKRGGSDDAAAPRRQGRSNLPVAAAPVREAGVSRWTAAGLMKPGAHTAAHRVFAAGLLCLGVAAAAYGTLQVTRGPRPVFIHVRWAPNVDETIRQESEQRYSLSEGELLDGRTWGYTLSDSSRTNIGALVSDAAVEDTQDIQRATFRVSPSAERLPYPPTSHPWIPVGLRVVTVLCLFIGLIGISFGLVERAAPGTTATWFVHRNVADPGEPQSKSWFDQPGKVLPVSERATWMPWAAAALAASLALGLSWCIARSPLTLNDGLGPILDSHRAETATSMFRNGLISNDYWRPLRLAQIKVVVDAAPADSTSAFKAIHVALTGMAFLLFAAWLRPRSIPELTAAAIALMILAGHHSFFVLFSEAYPINHFLEIVALALAVALLARGAPRWWKTVLAATILTIGALTIESGLLIGVVAIACWMVGWRGISGRGILLILLVLATYFYFRFIVFEISSPGLDERATGWWLTRLEPPELIARFGANPWPFYAYNVMASLLDVLASEPRSGTWHIVLRWLEDDVRPWMVIHIVSSLLVTGAMLVALVPALARWRQRALDDRDRFVLLAFMMIGANSVMSFGYVKDEVLSVGAAFYAAGAFAALANLGDRVYGRLTARSVAAALVLLLASVLWSTRATATFFSLEASAYKTANDWAEYSLERESPSDWSFEPTRRAYLAIRQRSLSRDVPHPAFTRQRLVDRYLEVR